MQAYQPPSVFNESIFFDYTPVPTFAGHINRYPFRIVISSSNDNEHTIVFDSQDSRSYKKQDDINKWSFLRPETRFLDLKENEITEIKTIDTKIYKDDNGYLNTVSGIFMGVSGYAEFYFVDDIFNSDLVIKKQKHSTIIATLQTSGINYFNNNYTSPIERSYHLLSTDYSNSLATVKQPHTFIYREPDYIKISENGIRTHINPRWQPSNQHTVFTFNWNKEIYTDINDGNPVKPILFEKNFNKSLPLNFENYINDIEIKCIGDKETVYFYDNLKISYKDDDGYLTPGYCKTFFNMATSVQNLKLSAVSVFKSPVQFGTYYNNKIWLSNKNAGQVNIVEYNAPHYIYGVDFKVNIYKVAGIDLIGYPELIKSEIPKAIIFNFDVPVVNPTFRIENNISSDPFESGGYQSIDSFAVLPSPYYQAWGVDSDQNMLYKFNTNGNILSAINLLTFYNKLSTILPPTVVPNQLSPTTVVLDSEKNIYISLYDNKFVLILNSNAEFDYILDLTSQISTPLIPNINQDWYLANQPQPNLSNDEYSEKYVLPTYLDIDKENKIWVTYSHFASGFLSKFDRNNNLYVNITYPLCSCPQDLIIDKNNHVWVALSNNIWNSLGKIEKRDTNGQLLSSFGPFMGVNDITLDLDQNLWFTYSYSRIGRIDTQTGNVYTFSIFNDPNAPSYFSLGLGTTLNNNIYEGFNPDMGLTNINSNTDETLFEGIGCDLRGFLYVINSIANQIIVYDTKTLKLIDKFYINPQGFNFWTPTQFSNTKIDNNFWGKSLKAHGDWTGLKWINKFSNISLFTNETIYKTITGESVPLNFVQIPSMVLDQQYGFLSTRFYEFILTNYSEVIKVYPVQETVANILSFNLNFYKINENFDMAEYIKSFAITPTLYDSTFLFDKFLPSIYGKYPYDHSDFGIFSYEKIANFVINHSDIDVCNLNNVYDLANMVNNKNDDYMLNYPEETKRLMDNLSINVSRLFGSTNKNQNYFTRPNSNGEYNLGEELGSDIIVNAGEVVVLRNNTINKFELISLGLLEGQYNYTIDDLAISLKLKVPSTYNVLNVPGIDLNYNDPASDYLNWFSYYTFYRHLSTDSNNYSDNIIDWNNPQTTLLNNVTSINDWFGDEEYIDMLFSYNLYRGLGIF